MPNVHRDEFDHGDKEPVLRPALNQFAEVKRHMQRQGLSVDEFNARQTVNAIGEMLQQMQFLLKRIMEGSVEPVDQRSAIFQCAQWLEVLGKQMEGGEHKGDVLRADREDTLLCMQWVAHMAMRASLSYSLDSVGAFRTIIHNLDRGSQSVPDLAPFVRPLDADR